MESLPWDLDVPRGRGGRAQRGGGGLRHDVVPTPPTAAGPGPSPASDYRSLCVKARQRGRTFERVGGGLLVGCLRRASPGRSVVVQTTTRTAVYLSHRPNAFAEETRMINIIFRGDQYQILFETPAREDH